jgi:hypothetical protein
MHATVVASIYRIGYILLWDVGWLGVRPSTLDPSPDRDQERESMSRRLLSPIAHVELLTPDLEKSVTSARDILAVADLDRVVGAAAPTPIPIPAGA